MARPRREVEPVPSVDWETFTRSTFKWRQGEHLSAIGPTGTGKTTTVLELLHERAAQSPRWHTAVLVTKPADDTIDRLMRNSPRGDWDRVSTWAPTWGSRQVVLWPRWRSVRDFERQRTVFVDAFESMFSSGSWCVFADELSYLVRELKLESWLRSFWQQGRSLNLTLAGATQRPAFVPLDLYSAATHLFLWRTNDHADLKRIGGVGGMASDTIREQVSTLSAETNEVLYLNSRTGMMVRTNPTRKVTAA